MRTTQRDAGAVVRLDGYITDAASGSGVASGVPYVWTRTSAGQYEVRFDTRLRIVSAVATCDNYTRVAMTGGFGVGTFTVVRNIGNTAAFESGNASFSVLCLDKR